LLARPTIISGARAKSIIWARGPEGTMRLISAGRGTSRCASST